MRFEIRNLEHSSGGVEDATINVSLAVYRA